MTPTEPGHPVHVSRALFLTAVSLCVGLAAVQGQSFWMDEGNTAFKALMPTMRDWWDMTRRLGGSDIQMPAYMWLVWFWHKLGADSEYALRAVNVPWLVVTVLALSRVRYWTLVCLASPFVTYYAGELRPYAMQIAGGALAASALIRVIENRGDGGLKGLHAVAGAALLLACSSLTAAVWAAGLWIGVLIIRQDWFCRKDFWFRLAPWICGAMGIGAYYAFTLLAGYRAAGMAGGGMLSLMFGCYELAGLLGLGPGRDELRNSISSLLPALPVLIPAFLCLAGAWLCAVRAWIKETPTRCVVGVACALMLPLIVLTVTGKLMDFRILGRHLSPMVPAVLLPLAAALSGVSEWRTPTRVLGILAMVFALCSSLSQRFLDRHARDDYRRASAIAFRAMNDGQHVWWRADMNTTRYYAWRAGGFPMVNRIQSLESEPPSSLITADMVVINRPDLRFAGQDYQSELKRNFFTQNSRFNGFEIWVPR